MMGSLKDELFVPLYEAERNATPSTVCVTGVTGFLAGYVVRRLLAAGHTVHGTCRNPNKQEAVEHLRAMEAASPGMLKLFKADLTQAGSFNEAMEGCTTCIHMASPFTFNVPKGKGKEMLIDPAVLGTTHVLDAVNATDSIKRVVLTSSVVAIYGDPEERGRNHVFTDKDWCTVPNENVLPYSASKREGEKKAWEMNKQQSRWQLVTINPSFILGPGLSQRTGGTSTDFGLQLVTNKLAWAPRSHGGIVSAEDVAAAHILAMVTPGASGRYICSSESLWFTDMTALLNKHYPTIRKGRNLPKWLVWVAAPYIGLSRDFVYHCVGANKIVEFDTHRVQEDLGLQFTTAEQTLVDLAEGLQKQGLVSLSPGKPQ